MIRIDRYRTGQIPSRSGELRWHEATGDLLLRCGRILGHQSDTVAEWGNQGHVGRPGFAPARFHHRLFRSGRAICCLRSGIVQVAGAYRERLLELDSGTHLQWREILPRRVSILARWNCLA
jgi:hypothetical protein